MGGCAGSREAGGSCPRSASGTEAVGTTQHSLPLVLIRSSHGYMKAFSVHRYPSSLDIIKNTISSDKSHYSSNCIPRYLPTLISVLQY